MLAGCVWLVNRPVCKACKTEDVWLTLADGTPIYGRLYVPPHAGDHLPAIVVCPGYLANLGFMEVPWAADLTHLGAVAFLLDRRGQGSSGGTWWPPADGSRALLDADPDIHAAVAYLRSRAPLIDPERIALLGHSDGGTGVLMAASADWDVAATVSISASLAPWEFVNHVAPADLLLVYGAEDRFILEQTDAHLISSATRGYLDGEGMVGQLRDGSARRLMRVPGRGHIGVLYSDAARREVLRWIADALRIDRVPALSPLRVKPVVIAVVFLAFVLLLWNGWPRVRLSVSWAGWLKVAALGGIWVCGLILAAKVVPLLRWVPAKEGAVAVAVLGIEMFLLLGAAALLLAFSARRPLAFPRAADTFANLGCGAGIGIACVLALDVILRYAYEMPLNPQRGLLFLFFASISLPAFAAVGGAARLTAVHDGESAGHVPLEMTFAIATAFVAPGWFVRMSVLPVYLLAAALASAAVYRAGGHPGGAAFGAMLYAHCLASVCAWY
jgi:dienelactone hydrolase